MPTEQTPKEIVEDVKMDPILKKILIGFLGFALLLIGASQAIISINDRVKPELNIPTPINTIK